MEGVLRSLIDSCPLCQRMSWKSDGLCPGCIDLFSGLPVLHRLVGTFSIFSLFHYTSGSDRLVALTKQGRNLGLVNQLSKLAFEKILCSTKTAGVIPMPARRFGEPDHAFQIAKHIAELIALPLEHRYLERTTTASQKEKNLQERSQNSIMARERFKLKSPHPWVLVDDVTTTGSTLLQAWHALGRPNAFAITFASTPKA